MLHGEWDVWAKPRRPLEREIELIFKLAPRIQPLAFCIEALMIDYIHRARQQNYSLGRGYTAVQWKRAGAL